MSRGGLGRTGRQLFSGQSSRRLTRSSIVTQGRTRRYRFVAQGRAWARGSLLRGCENRCPPRIRRCRTEFGVNSYAFASVFSARPVLGTNRRSGSRWTERAVGDHPLVGGVFVAADGERRQHETLTFCGSNPDFVNDLFGPVLPVVCGHRVACWPQERPTRVRRPALGSPLGFLPFSSSNQTLPLTRGKSRLVVSF
jgi:hypothetical protein